MKRIFLIGIILAIGLDSWGQGQTLISIGYVGNQGTMPVTGGNATVGVSGGAIGASTYRPMPLPHGGNADVVNGFPMDVSYFPAVFEENLFASKGYYPDFVELKWNVTNRADEITSFKIYRTPLGVQDSTLIATVPGNQSSYKDEFVQFGIIYKYTVFTSGFEVAQDQLFTNYVEGNGFALPEGTVSGRVTFEGGTAVQDVNIIAETDGELQGKSIYLNGTDASLVVAHRDGHNELDLEGGFTLQMWAKSNASGTQQLFNKGPEYELTYDQANLSFTVGDVTLTMPFTNPVDSFFQVTATYDPGDSLNLYATVNADTIFSKKLVAGSTPANNRENIVFGSNQNQSGAFFQGNIDEIRLWSKALTLDEIATGAYRFIPKDEDGLVSYWRLQAGIGDEFYDATQDLGEFNENHGLLVNATWSDITPGRSQLAYKGITDSNGNYVIQGIPYESSGSVYRFIPIFGVHEFDPFEQLRIIGPGSSVHNGIDFEDISSFAVSGTVRYYNTTIPVEGVIISIDGLPATDQDGNFITSDNLGRFTVDVPIGEHSLKVSKGNHVFVDEGRFPPPTGSPNVPTFDFNGVINGLEFVDSTLVRVAGRVVGGPVEAAYPLGFGLSNNNIGNASIIITPKSSTGDLIITQTKVDAGTIDPLDGEMVGTRIYSSSEEDFINSLTEYDQTDLTISADVKSGEYLTLLPPEEFIITRVDAGSYNVPVISGNLDLRNTFEIREENVDTLKIEVTGEGIIGGSLNDPQDFDNVFTNVVADTTFTIASDTFKLESRRDFILRVSPVMEVTNISGGQAFGEPTIKVVSDPTTDTKLDVPLYDDSGASVLYTLGQTPGNPDGYPVFKQKSTYQMKINLFEEYINADDGNASDQVPVVDGELRVSNDLKEGSGDDVLAFDQNGSAVYTFTAGSPNFSTDDEVIDYTRTLSMTAFSGNNGSISTSWPDSGPLRGYVLGAVPKGNSFVTEGPDEVFAILRDPPGSNSSTSWTAGTSINTSRSYEAFQTEVIDGKIVNIGDLVFHVAMGVGVAIIESTGVKLSLGLGMEVEESSSSSTSKSYTLSTSETISTSSDPTFVGTDGDVFVGSSTNIVYGDSDQMTIVYDDNEPDDIKLDIGSAVTFNLNFATSFIYTQAFIENELIPNLIELRNNLLTYSSDPLNEPRIPGVVQYFSHVEEDDPRFGTANDDLVWGAEVAVGNIAKANGPSYAIILPAGDDSPVDDRINYYNNQINGWIQQLRNNERAKVEAANDPNRLIENYSFDGGTSFSRSVTSSNNTTSSSSFKWKITASTILAKEIRGKAGIEYELNTHHGGGGVLDESTSTTTSNAISFTLDDGDFTDSYTVDVYKADDKLGPIFKVLGGATSCPYQDQDVTQYYNPGMVLHEKTSQVEKPDIVIEDPIKTGIPDNQAAEFTLKMTNNSETGDDVIYGLLLDTSTNPDGLTVSVDGLISGGRNFKVKAGETLTKTMLVTKNKADVFDYENVRILFESRCQSNPLDFVQDISADAFFSVHFQPSCTDIEISEPTNNWVVNSKTNPADILSVNIDSYDLNNINFSHIKFQYRGLGSALWITDHNFYKNTDDYTYALGRGEVSTSTEINGATEIVYSWDMSSLPDREYEIRAVAVCVLGPGDEIETPTPALLGIKDTKRPQLFGSPQPADGILGINDEISIQFDEPIVAGRLTTKNFAVKGVLNGRELTNGTSVGFDGVNDHIRVQNASVLSSSFTTEFWLQRDVPGSAGTVFSKGSSAGDRVQIGFDADKLTIEFSGQVITSQGLPLDDDKWHHYAISYDADSKKVSAYRDGGFVIDRADVTGIFKGEGPIFLGKPSVGGGLHFDGAIHEFRIWDTYLQQGQVASRRFVSLKGTEVDLIGYWPFDEGRGDLSIDLARSKQAEIFGEWRIQPQGYAANFDGIDDYLEINTGSTVIIQDVNDFMVEFWFKGATGQGEAALFSSGRGFEGVGGDDPNTTNPLHSLSIGFNSSGDLYASSNGQTLSVTGGSNEYLDDHWHHLALALKRKGNISFYLDGELRANTSAENFGGIAGANMWIGARGTTGAMTTTLDHYFDGHIDEFRIWKLARNIEQIDADRNAHIQGDELGLVAYYPFEHYEEESGIPVLNPTFDDQLINIQPDGLNLTGGEPNQQGVILDMESANIGLPRPVSDVDFTWTVNEDQIIITPNPTQADLIENVILDIVVVDVEDERGNVQASGASWTAFVDRNSIKWSERNLELSKEFLEPLSFEVEIINRAGSEESFSLTNVPPWLTAIPSSGSIAPSSTLTVEFTIAPDLNIGQFTEDIRLTTDFGFDEILLLDINVFTDPPAGWVVNPSDFELSMNVIGQVSVSGVISTDPNDILAAFVGDEIRGLSYLEYVSAFDNYQAFVTVYSDTRKGETLEFRIWDASAGAIRGDVTPNDIAFVSNSTSGVPSAPILFETTDDIFQELPVTSGWQWISFNLNSNSLYKSDSLLRTLSATQGDQIKGLSGIDDYSNANGWAGTLKTLKVGEMYKLKLANSGTINYQGVTIVPQDLPIDLKKDWNWLGFIPNVNMDINEGLGSLSATSGDIIKSQLQFAIYEQNIGWIGSLNTLRPGGGYMIKLANPGTLTYPNEGLINGRIWDEPLLHFDQWHYTPSQFVDNMTVIAAIEGPGSEDQSNYMVGAFVGDELRGVSEAVFDPSTNGHKFFLTIGGSSSDTEVRFMVLDDDGLISEAKERVSFSLNHLTGSLGSPLVLTSTSNSLFKSIEAFPNPFDQTISLTGAVDMEQWMSVNIYDLTGRLVRNLFDETIPVGNWRIEWDGQGIDGAYLRGGIYMVRFNTGGEFFNLKVIKE